MPLRTIVVVVLRIYTINIVVQGLVSFIAILPAYASLPDTDAALRWSYLYPVGLVVLGAILWCATLPLGRLVTKGHDVSITAVSLTKEDFYRFAFVFIGAYVVLNHVFPAVENGFKFFQYDFNEPPGSPQKGQYLAPFAADIVALILGFALVLGASQWTRKLLKREEASDRKRNLPP
jgi:hypothetical protein